ncbi:hypothetical protein [Pseudomonas protegens]|uniref:hypothetical protein n=1 Tax=Pseudomonas protegens TaxID=380021 RepID=UPI000CD266E4|nr:hypothetical protein [Pseudomonas protegens]POA88006.1 hypothetical protein C1883_16095 [Pseudomonas protegens]
MGYLKQTLQWVSATAAIVSSVLWLYSAKASVKSEDRRDESGLLAGILTETTTGNDIHESLKKQSKWNAYAAAVASFAAFIQGISMLLSE